MERGESREQRDFFWWNGHRLSCHRGDVRANRFSPLLFWRCDRLLVIPSRADDEGPHNKTSRQRKWETFNHSAAWTISDPLEIDLRL